MTGERTPNAQSAQETLTERRRTPRRPARAETVGSLLRPAHLARVVAQVYGGDAALYTNEQRMRARTELDLLANEEIARVVQRQIDAGLDVVSDGEFRRRLFTNGFDDAVDGIVPGRAPTFRNARGEDVPSAVLPIVARRLRKVASPLAREAAFLASITDYPFKVALPAGSWFSLPFFFVRGVTDQAYGSLEELVEDALGIQRALIAEAIDAGARYVQLDFPRYVDLIDERSRASLRRHGADPDTLLDAVLDADRRVIEGFPEEVTFALHLCRGNYRSGWLYDGALDRVAERMFNELPYDVFLVEWEDTSRQGDFSALRYLPKGPVVALGVVSSKLPRVESEAEVLARIDEASQYADVSQLALSAQCGFASEAQGNELTEDEQWRKLELIGRVADRVWGRA